MLFLDEPTTGLDPEVRADMWSGIADLARERGKTVLLTTHYLGAAFAALSNGFALIMRHEEALIGAVQFIVLPLTFLSTTFLAANLMPGWIRHAASFNPVNWAVIAGRSATSASADWSLVAARAGLLAALLTACLVFATRAFRAYQRSV